MTNLSIRLYVAITGLANRAHSDERGQDLLEWVLLSGLIAAAIVAVLATLTPFMNNMMTNIGHCIDFASSTSCNPGF